MALCGGAAAQLEPVVLAWRAAREANPASPPSLWAFASASGWERSSYSTISKSEAAGALPAHLRSSMGTCQRLLAEAELGHATVILMRELVKRTHGLAAALHSPERGWTDGEFSAAPVAELHEAFQRELHTVVARLCLVAHVEATESGSVERLVELGGMREAFEAMELLLPDAHAEHLAQARRAGRRGGREGARE